MTLYTYESDEGIPLVIEHTGRGEPPRTIREHGIVYALAGVAYDPKTDDLGFGLTMAAPRKPSDRDGRFVSHQQPRWDPLHDGEFTQDGKPLFTSRRQATKRADRERYETGVDVRYGDL